MEKNTDTYNESILKDIELGINDTCVKLVHYSKIDKTPEDVIEEAILKERLGALKIIKTELIRENDNREYRLSKDGETKVLLKLKAKHEEAMEDYKKVGRNDLYDHEKAELDVINSTHHYIDMTTMNNSMIRKSVLEKEIDALKKKL
jgi:uncharacterized protein YqeY